MTDFTTGIRRVTLQQLGDAVSAGEVGDLSVLWLPSISGRTVFGKMLEPGADGMEGMIAYNAFEDLEAAAQWLARHGVDSAALLIEAGSD